MVCILISQVLGDDPGSMVRNTLNEERDSVCLKAIVITALMDGASTLQ